MPKTGLGENYGPFFLIGAIASFSIFEVITKVGTFLADLEGDRTISYTLTLPIRAEVVFCTIAIYWAIQSAALTLLLFPIGKLLLWDRFDLGAISYGRLIPIYLSSHIFFGFFSLWIASLISGVGGLSSIFMRFINPLFMFGAYFYPWKAAYALSSWIGYVTLLNPMVYIMEGVRAAALGPSGYIPYWICLLALWVFIAFCALQGIHRLKKRLDCV